MTPTLDELIEYAQMEAEYWSGLRESKLTAFAIGTLHALKRLRELEESYQRLYDATTPIPFGDRVVSFVGMDATDKDSLTVQPTVTESLTVEPPVKDSLTTAPRPGVPTVEEVPDDGKCWVWSAGDEELSPCWYPFRGSIARKWASFFTHWLPYDAIPMPEEGE